ncbi:MAG: DUF4251 domain-containing protein [Bacteroidales bacterium]|jgi:hypothetical protein|nr:DUF4251 domain-containing protein [Bacteroidales bacterium]
MKRFLILAAALMMVLPSFAQKLSKEEKAAQQKALYETMVKALEEKDWAIVPTSYIDADGVDNQLTDNSIFISYEKTNMFMQGARVCGNSYTNIAEVKEYDLVKDKKGNLKKVVITVQGRHIQGRYQITMPKVDNGNVVDVIFQPSSGATRKFQGPIVPSKVAGFYKKSNPE